MSRSIFAHKHHKTISLEGFDEKVTIRALSAAQLSRVDDFSILDDPTLKERTAASMGIVKIGDKIDNEDIDWSALLGARTLVAIGIEVLDFTAELDL